MRWPIHPVPVPAECLHSWLRRISNEYDCLAVSDLTFDLVGKVIDDDDLDFDPPTALLEKIAGKTGVDVGTIRRMTFAGIAPSFFNGRPLPPDTFRRYVRAEGFLLPRGLVAFRDHPHWIPWYKAHRFANPRFCPRCGERPPNIVWRTLMLSCCPIHKLPPRSWPSKVWPFFNEGQEPEEIPETAAWLDGLTLAAFRNGQVDLAGRTYTLEEWARMLRTIVEELSVPYNKLGAEKATIRTIWRRVGKRPGNRLGFPYELLSTVQQFKFLHAASIAVDLIAHGSIAPARSAPKDAPAGWPQPSLQ